MPHITPEFLRLKRWLCLVLSNANITLVGGQLDQLCSQVHTDPDLLQLTKLDSNNPTVVAAFKRPARGMLRQGPLRARWSK